MNSNVGESLQYLISRYPSLIGSIDQINTAFHHLIGTVKRDGQILTCGNGGSAADADHIVGELMKGFVSKRRLSNSKISQFENWYGQDGVFLGRNLQGAIRAVSLMSHSALVSAYMNDCDPNLIFAQQVWGYGRQGDSLLCISTSGNSKNVVYAAMVGKVLGLRVIGLTGANGGRLKEIADVAICVPAESTSEIQELHLPVYHTLCLMLESACFDEGELYQT